MDWSIERIVDIGSTVPAEKSHNRKLYGYHYFMRNKRHRLKQMLIVAKKVHVHKYTPSKYLVLPSRSSRFQNFHIPGVQQATPTDHKVAIESWKEEKKKRGWRWDYRVDSLRDRHIEGEFVELPSCLTEKKGEYGYDADDADDESYDDNSSVIALNVGDGSFQHECLTRRDLSSDYLLLGSIMAKGLKRSISRRSQGGGMSRKIVKDFFVCLKKLP